jgi:hypothetical protein
MGMPIAPVPKNPIFMFLLPAFILSLERGASARGVWDAR